ncbi:MAG TPA: metallophosphoesterase [Tepidisphaeraceae bacterium]
MTILIASILSLLVLLNIFVCWRMYALLGAVRRPRIWRVIVLLLTFSALAFCAVVAIFLPILGSTRNPLPHWLVSSLYIWHFLLLPLMFLALLIDLAVRGFRKLPRLFKPASQQTAPAESLPSPMFSRRNFLTSLGVTAVPVAAVSLAGIAKSQLGKFRIQPYDLSLAGWPRELDGYTITVIADVHTGVYTTQKMLDDIVQATNRLKADLILLAGDLINISLSDLPNALDMVLSLSARDGVFMIQGNHDVIQGPDHFDHNVRRRGVNLLVDDAVTITPAGGVPFQLLGTRWTSDQWRDETVAYTAGLRDPSLFAIMLAHHPHSWDVAADAGIPLVISGHTHGGQIMLTDRIGGGPLRFKYWSGRYDKPKSTLIVSNGVGNWFPLRINAPAEILHITMHAKI